MMKKQSTSSTPLLQNFPIRGRILRFLEKMGPYIRKYLISHDRLERPFSRAARNWIYKAADAEDTTIAFGSTRNINAASTFSFVNHPFPVLKEDTLPSAEVTIGPYADIPFSTSAIFNISAASYGALSAPAIKALSHGAKRAGIWLNTGESGLSPHHLESGCDLIFQIGTAKYGVRDKQGKLCDERLRNIAKHPQVRMFELKISQGAKPGYGSVLPADKLTADVAAVMGVPEGQSATSPNRIEEINSIDSLLDMVARVRAVTGKPTGFKTAIGSYTWLETLCKAIISRGGESAPDFITIDGAEGGTGAAPMSMMDFMSLPLQECLPRVIDIVSQYGLQERIRIIASGGLATPPDVAWALCEGADFVHSTRGFMFALGCVQALKCHTNNCPTGIASHNPKLQKGLDVKGASGRIAYYVSAIEDEVSRIAWACGAKQARDLSREHLRKKG